MSEWGPWIEHDGKGCPCVGVYGQAVKSGAGVATFPDGSEERVWEGIFVADMASWDWRNFLNAGDRGGRVPKVIRYRIRKPRGMTILESLLENLPDEVTA